MSRVVTWSVCGLVVALAWGVSAQPASVAGEARPWSGAVSSTEVEAAWARCAELSGTEDAFTLGPAWRREDGHLLIGAISGKVLVKCSVHESGVSITSTDPAATAFREQPFATIMLSDYGDRPGFTIVGYAGHDAAAVEFRGPDGRVIPAQVKAGVFLADLSGSTDYQDGKLVHVVFDATGAVIPGR